MDESLEQAVAAINDKLGGADLPGTVKFVIDGAGAIVVDAQGARVADDAADVTLTADKETFMGMMQGDVNPTQAFMTGKLSVDGDMGLAMQLASVMS